ncbi:Ku protein [Streptomyces sp. NPDC001351]|uniref:non-homologous end joining protein Ku n=1 Tax=Streptomyces sp. NPDC001351 TaxID=3364564 RepID=UPI00369BE79B
MTLGPVTVPVALFTATEDHTVHFHQLQRGTSDRIRNKRVNERTGKEAVTRDIVKGYDLGGGDYVVVEPAELDEIAPGKSKVIDMVGFVDLADIEPVYFGRTFYLAPRGKDDLKVYELLRTALERADKAGIATFTMHGKQCLTALRAQRDVLVLHTMHGADEVREPDDVADLLPDRRTKTTSQEVRTAQQLIDRPSGAARRSSARTSRRTPPTSSTSWTPCRRASKGPAPRTPVAVTRRSPPADRAPARQAAGRRPGLPVQERALPARIRCRHRRPVENDARAAADGAQGRLRRVKVSSTKRPCRPSGVVT